MTSLKRILLVLTAAVMSLPLYCCSDDKSEEDTSASVSDTAEDSAGDDSSADDSGDAAAEEEVQGAIPLEYDGTEVPDAAAEVIGEYFRAIMNQNYDGYKAVLDPYYCEVYDSWLDGTFGYGMETSFETMHQSVMEAAGTADTVDGTVEKAVITKLELSATQPAEGEEMADVIDEYLTMYDNTIGEGFTDELRAQCDDIINITFTMTADCDGTELEIMSAMEILLTVTDGEYHIMG